MSREKGLELIGNIFHTLHMKILRLTKVEAYLDSYSGSIAGLARQIGVEPDWLKCVKNRKMKDPGTNKIDKVLFYADSQGWKYKESKAA